MHSISPRHISYGSAMDEKRVRLRHTLATLAYRAVRAMKKAPASVAGFGSTGRRPDQMRSRPIIPRGSFVCHAVQSYWRRIASITRMSSALKAALSSSSGRFLSVLRSCCSLRQRLIWA